MSFLGEIKRRKVFQVTAVYVVVAWVIIQVIDVVAEPLSLPDWLDTVVIVLLIAGLPVAIILAWALEVTPEGIIRTLPSSNEHEEPTSMHAKAPAADPEETVLPNSVAVLPFENLSPEPEDAYFAAGVHEEILNQLAKIRDIHVIARTSVLQYAGTTRPVGEIAAELNVGALMEGTIRYSRGRVRITSQLIDAANGTHLWSETYDRQLDDIFQVETDIATRIAEALKATLSPEERKRIQRVPTHSREAHALYLKALENRRTVGLLSGNSLKETVNYLDRALEFDPAYAAAYALKARIYAEALTFEPVVASQWEAHFADREQTIQDNVKRALELDPELGLTYSASAYLHQWHWQKAEAESAYDKALRLSPNDPLLITDAAFFYLHSDQHEKAIELARRAVDLDPFSVDARSRLCVVLGVAGENSSSMDAGEQAVAVDPSAWIAHHVSAESQISAREPDRALESLRSAERLLQGAGFAGMSASWAYIYRLAGDQRNAERLAAEFTEMAKNQHAGPGSWAMAKAALDKYDEAERWLRKASEERSADPEGWYQLMFLRANFYKDPELEQPRFVEMRSRLGFKE